MATVPNMEDAEIALKKWGAQRLASAGEPVEDWHKVEVRVQVDTDGCDTCDYGAGAELRIRSGGQVTSFALDAMGGYAPDGQGFQRMLAEVLAIEITDEDRV